jgi:hypothetical protein
MRTVFVVMGLQGSWNYVSGEGSILNEEPYPALVFETREQAYAWVAVNRTGWYGSEHYSVMEVNYYATGEQP